ncbi:MAG: histidine kinase [Sphaerochaeta sp.]|nr:histidine kinase [Sphaerochaeta sp.]
MQKKIFLWFVLIVVLPSGIIYFIANHLFIQYAVDQQIHNNNQIIQEMRKNLDTKLHHYQQLSMQFYLNDQAMEEIHTDTPIIDCRAIKNQLDGFVNSNRLVASAYLITEKGIVFSGTGIQEIEAINTEIQPTLASLEGRMHWTRTYQMITNFGLSDTFFFGARHIRQEQQPIATLILAFNSLFFEDFFQYTPFSKNQEVTVTNNLGQVIATNHPSYTERPFGKTHIRLSSASNASDWNISLVLDTRNISGELTFIRTMFNLSVVLYLLFFLIISHLISKRLTKQIHALTNAVNTVGEGMLDIQVDVNHQDEIKQLSIGFNAMTNRIQKLLQEVKLEEESKRKAHMQTLQLQLTPHMLYNSLNTIRWMAQINGQENIRRITLALTRYLRSLSDIESEYIPLRKELELMEDYAVIQRFRYQDFTIIQDIPEELQDYLIHKFMIVNLVENSIIHGLADLPEPGLIHVQAKIEGETLYITVSDNGRGLPQEITDSLTRKDTYETDELTHTGLRNIQTRLRLYHGPDYSLLVDSQPNQGCRVTIPLPLITREP